MAENILVGNRLQLDARLAVQSLPTQGMRDSLEAFILFCEQACIRAEQRSGADGWAELT